MPDKALLVEKLFFVVILIYIFIVVRYSWKIRTSKFYIKYMIRADSFWDAITWWYLRTSKIKLIFSILLISGLATGGWSVYSRLDPDKRFHRLINNTDTLVKQQKFDQAVIDMKNALKLRPRYTRGHFFLANLYRNRGEQVKAERSLWNVMEINVDYKHALGMLDEMLASKRDADGMRRLADLMYENYPEKSRIYRAKGFLYSDKYDEAKVILEDALSTNPKNWEILRLLGDIFVQKKEPARAIAYFQKAVLINFALWEAHFSLANLYMELGKTDLAVSKLNTTRSLNSDFSLPTITLANIYFNKGEKDRAIKLLEELINKKGGDKNAEFALANLYIKMERLQEASNIFGTLENDYGSHRGFLSSYSFVLYRLKKPEMAIKRLDKLQRIGNMTVAERRILGRVQFALGFADAGASTLSVLRTEGKANEQDILILKDAGKQFASAMKKFDKIKTKHADLEKYYADKNYDALIEGASKAIEENSSKGPFYNLLAVGHLYKGNLDLAQDNFLLAYKSNTRNIAPLMNLVTVYSKMKKHDEAQKILIEHNKQFPKEITTKLALGKLLLNKGRPLEAYSLFRESAIIDTKASLPHQLMGVTLRIVGRLQESLIEYERAIELNPEDATSLNDAASFYGDAKANLKRGKDYAQRAVKLLPRSGSSHDTLGWVNYQMGNYKEAVDNFKTAYELNPNFPLTSYRMGLAWYKLKRYKEAENSFKIAVSIDQKFLEKNDAIKKLEELKGLTG